MTKRKVIRDVDVTAFMTYSGAVHSYQVELRILV
jgi:hypothetical protein